MKSSMYRNRLQFDPSLLGPSSEEQPPSAKLIFAFFRYGLVSGRCGSALRCYRRQNAVSRDKYRGIKVL